MKTFHNKEKLREFTTTRLALQKILKGPQKIFKHMETEQYTTEKPTGN
jgi:hypothetical protein